MTNLLPDVAGKTLYPPDAIPCINSLIALQNPNSPTYHTAAPKLYILVLFKRGFQGFSITSLQRARQLAPLSMQGCGSYDWILSLSQQAEFHTQVLSPH